MLDAYNKNLSVYTWLCKNIALLPDLVSQGSLNKLYAYCKTSSVVSNYCMAIYQPKLKGKKKKEKKSMFMTFELWFLNYIVYAYLFVMVSQYQMVDSYICMSVEIYVFCCL